MPILDKQAAEAILKKVLSFSKADECQAVLSGSDGANVRYAKTAVSTSGAIETSTLAVSSAFGKRQGVVTLNEYDDASLEKAVRTSEELARLAPENPEFVSYLGPQHYAQDANTWIAATASIDPSVRASMVAQSLATAKAANLVAAGFLEHAQSFAALMNSKGLSAYYKDTSINFSITMRTPDGHGSGYSIKGYNDVAFLDTKKISETAAFKAAHSKGAKAIEPGKYTVILEPTASIVLLERLIFGLDARQADEGRSFLSASGGKTKLGEKMVDDKVTIYSDPHHPILPGAVWNEDGRPQEKTVWIDKGVVKNTSYSRFWAQKKGVTATPAPDSFIMEGGEGSLADLIRSTERGILVTKLWYIRVVDPQTLLLTGLTRDGTFFIENGRITYPVKNFRFNESPVILLNNLDALAKSERTVSTEGSLNAMIPPMRVRDFTFSSLSDAV